MSLNHNQKLVIEGVLAANAAHALSTGRDRPQTREGGMIPSPQPRNTTEAASQVASDAFMGYLLGHFILGPLFIVFAALAAVAIGLLHSPGLAIALGVLFVWLVHKIFRGLLGKKVKPTAAAPVPQTAYVLTDAYGRVPHNNGNGPVWFPSEADVQQAWSVIREQRPDWRGDYHVAPVDSQGYVGAPITLY